MPKNDRPFNVLLTPDHAVMLAQLAITAQCSKGQVLRDAIRWRFAATCNHQPTCAAGRPCLVPHLHPTVPTPPVPMPAADATP